MPRPSRWMRWIGSLALLLVSLGFCLVVAEGVLRWHRPGDLFGAADELFSPGEGEHEVARRFTVDPEFGFRPILGNEHFDEFGTHRNPYPLEKTAGRTRLLFIGDSVTARGRIVSALRNLYGSERFEFWNAGVESFGTVQEVAFYQRYNAGIHPDHVILSFHLNDFVTTPVAFRDAAGRLRAFRPNRPSRELSPWLFEHSSLYRAYLGLSLSSPDPQEIPREVDASLGTLQQNLAADGIRFTVLVLPLLKPFERWNANERGARSVALQILERRKIRHFDLLEPLEDALRGGVPVQERPGDIWHPSQAAASAFGAYLFERGLL